jgi:hypothetical protein
VGRAVPGCTTLHLDDLIADMRCVARVGAYPYCSLDPRPENMRELQALLQQGSSSSSSTADWFRTVKAAVGPQQIVVGGVPRNSRHAHVMIDADYHMKKVSQGLIRLPNVMSCLDHSLERAKAYIAKGEEIPDSGARMSRFWFHVQQGHPTFQEAEGIVWLDDCQVVVLTEKQATTASGELYDVEEDDPIANAFARNLSREFTNLTASVPVYADLEHLFRLHAVLLAMRHHRSLAIMKTDFGDYLPQYQYRHETPMGLSLPGLANQKEFRHETPTEILVLTWLACGGVSMDIPIVTGNFHDFRRSRLSRFRARALLARPSEDDAVWEVRASANLVMYWPLRPTPHLWKLVIPSGLLRGQSELGAGMMEARGSDGLADVVVSLAGAAS